ncbi:MAG: hypothetical protein IJ741_08805 [Schwartzia sp.]|nr:hypothetical protein [Schwartzia sp. (in: firmicutes)]
MVKLSKEEKDRLYARLCATTKDPAKILDDCADSMHPQSILKIASELQIGLTQEQAKDIADECSLFNGNIALLLAILDPFELIADCRQQRAKLNAEIDAVPGKIEKMLNER